MNTVSETSLSPVDFHGQTLFLVDHNDQPFTPMKPIVEGMGLDWAGQFTKLKDKSERFSIEMISMVAADGKDRQLFCMPLRKLPAWLLGINPKKVRQAIRKKVVMYQRECDDALWDYWTKGQATNPRATLPAPAAAPRVVGIQPVPENLKLEPIYIGEGQSKTINRHEIKELVEALVDVLDGYGWSVRTSSIYRLIAGRFGVESVQYLAKKDVPVIEHYLNSLIGIVTGAGCTADLQAPTTAIPAPVQAPDPALPAAPTIPTPPAVDMTGLSPHEQSRMTILAQLDALDKVAVALDDYLFATRRIVAAEADKLTDGVPAAERAARRSLAGELKTSYSNHTHALTASVNAIRSVLRVTATAAGMILPYKGRAKPRRAALTA